MDTKSLGSIVDFLYEVGILAKTPRSGFYFLGSGSQSVAEHINRVVYIGFTLGMMTPGVDVGKILKMCLLHDLTESRISDLNYVHQKYTERHEHKAIEDLAKTLPFGDHIVELVKEYESRETMEARLAKDADRLEWLMALKEQYDTGNARAASWLPSALKRMDTDIAKELGEKIINTPSDNWWFGDKDDEWWITRNKNK
ncbi:MAG TPA: HD domain-containing protein [Candidatus Binatia bacterium]|nr:HD domain-containing protein [Candidatus Binatia bacterium]